MITPSGLCIEPRVLGEAGVASQQRADAATSMMSGPRTETVLVRTRPATYLHAGGSGRAGSPTVLFVHGWGLSHASYRPALARVARAGVRVLAPALPGFGGTAALPTSEHSLAGYARWVADFLDAVGVRGPVTVVGHSFGGGVGIRLAHDQRARVARLVLVNSIGGSAWGKPVAVARALRARPPWDWGLYLPAELRPIRQLTRVLLVVAADAAGNALRNPLTVARVARLAATADLRVELGELKRRQLPIVVVWGHQDRVLPAGALAALRLALGDPPLITLAGGHSWLLSDGHKFSEVISNVVEFTDISPRSRAHDRARPGQLGRRATTAPGLPAPTHQATATFGEAPAPHWARPVA
jgi:pimeloyl-ACP methyl ester carboxylesterase